MLTSTEVFRPMLSSGQVYARALGSTDPMQIIGGVEELVLSIDEERVTQKNFATPGGGNRAQVNRIDKVSLKAKLQDLNALNLARAVFGVASKVDAGSVTDEAVSMRRGTLIRSTHVNPSSVVLKKADDTVISAAGNYEVRPEGVFIFDNATALTTTPEAGKLSYSYGVYHAVQALVSTAPILEMIFAGINEAMSGKAVVIDFYRVQFSPTSELALIGSDFATLPVEGEVLLDPTKSGSGVSRYFRKQLA